MLKYINHLSEKDRINCNSIGIYKITFKNASNGKCYIGSALSKSNLKSNGGFYARLCSHIQSLRNGTSGCNRLTNAVNKYGIENLEMSIVEIMPPGLDNNEYFNRETYYIEKFNSYNFGYNATKISNSALGVKRSEKFSDNVSNSKFKKLYKYSLEGDYLGPIERQKDFGGFKKKDLNFNKTWDFYYKGFNFEEIFLKEFKSCKADFSPFCKYICYNRDGSFYKAFMHTHHIQIHFKLAEGYNFGNLYNFKKGKVFLGKLWKKNVDGILCDRIPSKTPRSKAKKLYCYDIENEKNLIFNSSRECSEKLDIGFKLISKCIKSGNNYTSGYLFSYSELDAKTIDNLLENLNCNSFAMGRIKLHNFLIYSKILSLVIRYSDKNLKK